MGKARIRPIAIGILLSRGRILVYRGRDEVAGRTFYRPLGGGLHFGESGAEALVREMREETGCEVRVLEFLSLIENRFTLRGEPGHELVLVYRAEFTSAAPYEQDTLAGHEDDGSPLEVLWMDLAALRALPGGLVPEELWQLPLLSAARDG